MNRLIKYLTLAAAVAGLAATARALPIITGGISLSGGLTLDTGNVNSAVSFTTNNVSVSSESGSFTVAGVTLFTPGSVIMPGFTFNPFPGTGVNSMWYTSSGPAASFDLLTLTSRVQGNDAMELRGMGTLHLVGYDNTPGTWLFTANQANASFSWSSSNGSVPDGGTTALLLGAGLSGLALISRRQKRKS